MGGSMKAGGVALVLVVVLLAGCTEALDFLKPKPKTPEAKAEALARQQTVEGKALATLANAFDKTRNCSEEEYLRVAELAKSFVKDVKLETDPAKAQAIVAASKACDPRVDDRTTRQAESVYRIEYEVRLSPSCPYPELLQQVQGQKVVVEANLQTGKARVLEGDFDEAARQQIEAMLPGLPLMGNCVAALTLGSGLLPGA